MSRTNIKASVYEVLRIIDGKPLFLEDHFERFMNSCKGSGFSTENKLNKTNFYNEVQNLLKSTGLQYGNIKISVNYREQEMQFSAKVIPHKYPTNEEYANGIDTICIKAGRNNPGLKVWNENLRNHANEMIKNNQVYEVLLINEQNCITEGSRSNVFFIRKNFLISPPADEILHGITRMYVLKCSNSIKDIKFVEKDIKYTDLKEFESAFITGTSPKILPVRKIDDYSFNVENTYMRELMLKYDAIIDNYITSV